MLRRRTALTAAFAGAAVGVSVLVVAYLLAGWWYASAGGLVVLALTPGIVVGGMLNPMSTAAYFAIALVVQAISYAGVVVLAAAVIKRRGNHAGPHAV